MLSDWNRRSEPAAVATGRVRDALPALAAARPIVLVHGFACSSRALLPLERRLRRSLRRTVVRVDLRDHHGLHLQDIRESARIVGEVVEGLAGAPGFEFADIVGHSMGGLTATYLLKQIDRGRRIRRVITLGTPHCGTPAAIAGVLFFGLVSRGIWQMLPGSPLLRELGRTPVPACSELISIAAQGDSVVPANRARLTPGRGQRNLTVADASHVKLLLAANISDVVSKILASPRKLAAAA